MAWEWLQSVGAYTLSTINYAWSDIPTRLNASDITFGTMGVANISEPADYKFDIDAEHNFYYFVNGATKNRLSIGLHLPSGRIIGSSQSGGSSTTSDTTIAIQIDTTLQEARVVIFNLTSEWTPKWTSSKYYTYEQELYQAIINTPIPQPYNWQSVPSISGKNGILQSLVQIKEEALNDGEPVSEATVLSFDSLGNINIPSVIDEQMPVDPSDVTSVTATYLIPALENGTYDGIKLLVKKDSIPTSEEDADKVVNLEEPTSILRIDSKSVGNLDEDSRYFFVVKLIDDLGTEATSDPKDIWTSHSEGWSFDYTGEIQTFVAPKTGIYQLETWGAQGGDATDGTLTARGGYGAYAVGEVFLTQGETIYINVGGQNGYGGGGNFEGIETDFEDLIQTPDLSHCKVVTGWNYLTSYAQYIGTDWNCHAKIENSSNGTITKSDTEYCIDSKQNMGISSYIFVLPSGTKIKKMEFEGKFTNSYINQDYRIQLVARKVSSGSIANSGRIVIGHNNGYSDQDYNVTDQSYHTFEKEFETPIEADYIELYQAYYPAYFKNIKLTIVS